MVNGNELRIVGMSRSGNHAIINWILRQIEGRYCFLNCAEPKTNPFHSARPMAADPGEAAERCLVNYGGFALEREQEGQWTPKDFLAYSYEDCFLGMIHSKVFEARREEYLGESQRKVDILILRDPFNLFASRKKKGGAVSSDLTTTRIWKQHAREYLGKRRYLSRDRIAISYNRWVADGSYREQIARELGLNFTDAGFEEIPTCNGGSSFDGRAYNGRASNMRVFERWRHFADDESYWSLFDPDMMELAAEIFEDAPGGELLPLLDSDVAQTERILVGGDGAVGRVSIAG